MCQVNFNLNDVSLNSSELKVCHSVWSGVNMKVCYLNDLRDLDLTPLLSRMVAILDQSKARAMMSCLD